MTSLADPSSSTSAAPLGDDEIALVRLPYRREWGRDPLRRELARQLGTEAGDVRLVDDEHGRPALAGAAGKDLRFNWSHSGDQALIALSRHVQPGVDLERMRPRPRALEIAQRYFAAAEWTQLRAALPLQRDALFLKLWTAKEALLKAHGRGLAFGLHRLSVTIVDDQPTLTSFEGEDHAAWQLHSLPLERGWSGSLAWRGPAMRIRWARDPDALPLPGT